MRGVILHDFFSSIGGGEKVVLAIASCLDIDIITTDIDLPIGFFAGRNIHSIGRTSSIPGLKQTIAAARFNCIQNLEQYDYMICSGNWAHHAANLEIPSIYYCQDAPVRALYDLYPEYLHRQNPIIKPGFATWANLMRRVDQSAIRRISKIIANSSSVKKRVQRYYNRDAEVIYPPIDIEKFSYKSQDNFWLSVNRLYPDKRIELQIETFAQIPDENLIIIGGVATGDHAVQYSQNMLQLIAQHPNITVITHGISESELLDLYSHCKGVICTSHAEAFGLVAIEAMASGKPVIAVAEGGYLETVIDGKTGFLVEPMVQSIMKAIQIINQDPTLYQDECISQADRFGGMDTFCTQFHRIVRSLE